MLTQEEILTKFLKGYNCTQIVYMAYAEKLGITEEKALEIASENGSATFRGGVCGALDAACGVLRLLYEEDADVSEKEIETKINNLKERFAEENGSDTCNALLGIDMTKVEDLDLSDLHDRLTNRCPGYVASALSLIEEEIAAEA